MTLYELIFILLFLVTMVSLLLRVFLKKRGGSRKILLVLASVWCVYLAILAITDALSSQRVFKVGEEQCFDEMCFAVTDAQTMPAQELIPSAPIDDTLYIVNIRATSHSRGRAQAEGGLRGRLYEHDAFMNVSVPAQNAYEARYGESPRLTQKLDPGQSILSILVFEAPHETKHPALALDHGFTPGYFVIGESPFFHKPDIHQLSNGQ